MVLSILRKTAGTAAALAASGGRSSPSLPCASLTSKMSRNPVGFLPSVSLLFRGISLLHVLQRNNYKHATNGNSEMSSQSSCIVVVASTRVNISMIDLHAQATVSVSSCSTILVFFTTFLRKNCNPAIISGA